MAKTKIFTSANMLKYGFTDQEITQLNTDWEQKAARLGLEEHLPEYWQEAKQHMSEIISGRSVEQMEMEEIHAGDADQVDLPSLDIDLNEFSLPEEADNGEQVEITLEELLDLEDILDEEITFEETPEEGPAEPEIIEIEETTAPAVEDIQEEIAVVEVETPEEPEEVQGLEEDVLPPEEETPAEDTAQEEKEPEPAEIPLEPEKEVSPVEEDVLEKILPKEEEAREEIEEPVVAEAEASPVEEDVLEEPPVAQDEAVRETEEPLTLEEEPAREEPEKESFFTKILKMLKIK